MATRIDTTAERTREVQEKYFRITNRVPDVVWYWAALGSIVTSSALFLVGRRDWSIFVGQWPPTFLLFGLFHKLLASSQR